MNYKEYLSSKEWNAKRLVALERAGHKCQTCAAFKHLQVHHNTYERLFKERPEDLVVLCGKCHALFHGKIKSDRHRKKKRSRLWPLRGGPCDGEMRALNSGGRIVREIELAGGMGWQRSRYYFDEKTHGYAFQYSIIVPEPLGEML